MRSRAGRMCCAAMLVLVMGAGVWAAETTTGAKDAKTTDTKPAEVKVSLSASDTKVKELLESLAKQSKEKLILESSVGGTVGSLSLKDVSLEPALTAVCKAAKLEWRKVYIAQESKLTEQPDKFAAIVRLMSGLSFPDLLLAGSSTGKTAIHLSEDKAVGKAREVLPRELGFTQVYLVTNDAAAAARALAKENGKTEPGSEAVGKYTQMAKEQMDMFMKMTPEEREQVIFESLNLIDQVDPSYMSSVMQTLMNSDPENLKRMVQKQTEVLFHMSEEQRRAMMKFNMKSMEFITPEQRRMLEEDAKAIMQEMQREAGQ